MPARIELEFGSDRLKIDGEEIHADWQLIESADVMRHIQDEWGLVFAGLYIEGRRIYDAELWIYGQHKYTIPSRDVFVDDLYDQIEAAQRDQR
jgi:hypothetical protein